MRTCVFRFRTISSRRTERDYRPVIANSPRTLPYQRRNPLPPSSSVRWPPSLTSHPPLSLRLLFILSRSICIIFKFRYTARPSRRVQPPSRPVHGHHRPSLSSSCCLAHPLSIVCPRRSLSQVTCLTLSPPTSSVVPQTRSIIAEAVETVSKSIR